MLGHMEWSSERRRIHSCLRVSGRSVQNGEQAAEDQVLTGRVGAFLSRKSKNYLDLGKKGNETSGASLGICVERIETPPKAVFKSECLLEHLQVG